MYADNISESMQIAINETKRRRQIQEAYNQTHNIIPKTIIKEIPPIISNNKEIEEKDPIKLTKEEKIK